VRVRRYLLLVSLVLLCLLLLTLQTRGLDGGPVGDVLSSAWTAAQSVLAKAHRAALGVWTGYVDWKTVRAENARLRGEAEQLRVDALGVEETRQENARLRRLLHLKARLPLATVSGEVIGREAGGWVRALTVNRGVSSGIVRQTPVIVPEGLVGRVIQARPGASVVQLLSDPASTVGGVVQRTRTAGLVEGDPSGVIRLKFMARDGAGVAAGDLVVTSGVGGVFPKGVPVGRIRAVEDRGSALFHYAVLEPVVDVARLEEVLLVVGPPATDAQDVARLFGGDG
jgi:rod shape-determining protein MreC